MNTKYTLKVSSELFEDLLTRNNILDILKDISDAFFDGEDISNITLEDCADDHYSPVTV